MFPYFTVYILYWIRYKRIVRHRRSRVTCTEQFSAVIVREIFYEYCLRIIIVLEIQPSGRSFALVRVFRFILPFRARYTACNWCNSWVSHVEFVLWILNRLNVCYYDALSRNGPICLKTIRFSEGLVVWGRGREKVAPDLRYEEENKRLFVFYCNVRPIRFQNNVCVCVRRLAL